jgi:hypothetical protein
VRDANARPAALLGTLRGGGKKIRIWGRSRNSRNSVR